MSGENARPEKGATEMMSGWRRTLRRKRAGPAKRWGWCKDLTAKSKQCATDLLCWTVEADDRAGAVGGGASQAIYGADAGRVRGATEAELCEVTAAPATTDALLRRGGRG